jgi:homocysteine S-methyltransferase
LDAQYYNSDSLKMAFPPITYPLLLDGGLSHVLESQGHDLNHSLWSARLLDENPEAIVAAHTAYLKAGAQCLITSSYQASVPGLMDKGYTQEKAQLLIQKTVSLAEEAIHRMGDNDEGMRPLIAASIGPYGAFLADGSEYRGDYGVDDATLQDYHQPRLALLEQTAADCFACETNPSLQEAKVLSALLEQGQKPAWFSFSCRDKNHLNDGTPIADCVALLKEHPNVFAMGVNCTPPQYISGLIQSIKASGWEQDIVVYPNSGEAYHAETKSWQEVSNPMAFAEMAQEWLALGANMVGGCCRIGPESIQKLADRMSK